MIDINGLITALQTDPSTRKTAMVGGGAALAGLAAGMLTGKSGRKFVGKAAKYGAVAALGGLAYHAVTKMRTPAAGASEASAGAPAAAPATPMPAVDYDAAPENTAYLPAAGDHIAFDARAKSLVRAMISAAKADGEISAQERAIIQERMAAFELNGETRTFVELELVKPLNLDEVTRDVEGVEHAAEVYAASLVAIDDQGPVEKAYLGLLAARLRLEREVVDDIHTAARSS
ncbi:tellurite resistance TerB family protein [Woodsholea maritima]|uniref:tellurite resistance TerB family protein n=1 Tax=Woodsholea maritima TaxID=240237 RepID=UPI000361DD5E|nr:DUF533 domain-containing protein [Woodsholea maritima]